MLTLLADRIFDGDDFRQGYFSISMRGPFLGPIVPLDDADGAPLTQHDNNVVDVRGMLVIPGLINTHVHIARGGGFETDEPPLPIQAAKNFSGALASGTTTVADLGSPPALMRALQRVVHAPSVSGPDLFAAGPILTAPNGYPLDWMPKWVADLGAATACDGPNHAKRVVENVARAGMSFIKLAIMSLSYAEKPLPSIDVPTAKAIVEEAHRLGMRVLTHAHSQADYRVAIEAGVDALMHSAFDPIDDETVARVVDSGISVCPTLWVFDSICALDDGPPTWSRLEPLLTDPIVRSLRRFAEAYRESNIVPPPCPAGGLPKSRVVEAVKCASANLRLLDDAGANIVFGNDAAYGFSLTARPADELGSMQRAGMSPRRCLQGATSRAAAILGLADRGKIVEGMRADLVVVPRDVERDLRAIERPSLVIKAGRIVSRGSGLIDERRHVGRLVVGYGAGIATTLLSTGSLKR